MHVSRSSSKLLLSTVLALSASASAQTSKPSAVYSSTAQKPHVFVSAMTRPGAHVTGPQEYQYRFDRALEKEVAKKYALVPYDTKPALLQTLMKTENYYWVGGSSGSYSAYAAHPRYTFAMNEAKPCDIVGTPEKCATEAAAYVDEIIREDNGYEKPESTKVDYSSQAITIYAHYEHETTQHNVIVVSWADNQEAVTCARIVGGLDQWVQWAGRTVNLGVVLCFTGAKVGGHGFGSETWYMTQNYQVGLDGGFTKNSLRDRLTQAAIQQITTILGTNFSDNITHPVQTATEQDWEQVKQAHDQYAQVLQKHHEESVAQAPAKLAELQKQEQALTQRNESDKANLHQLVMTPVVDNNKQTADLRAQAKTNPAGLAAMLQAQTDQYQQGAAAQTQRASQFNQDMKYCYQELDKVHKQEQEQQAILKYASATPKVDDLPIPGRKVIPPLWQHRQAPEYTEQALANKINGSVLLSMVVDETGHPQNIKVLRGLGYGLDEKAVSSMVGSVFQPARKNGSPVPFDMQVEVSFDVR